MCVYVSMCACIKEGAHSCVCVGKMYICLPYVCVLREVYIHVYVCMKATVA